MRFIMLSSTLLIVVFFGFADLSYADDLETQLNAQQRGMLQMQNSIEVLQARIASHDGEIEELNHKLDALSKENAFLKEQLAKFAANPEAKPAATEAAPQNPAVKENATAAKKTVPAAAQTQSQDSLSPLSAEGKAEYDAAYALILKNDLAGAEKAFSAFIAKNKNSQLTPNAWYWQGQAEYKLNKLDDARVSFLNAASFKSSSKRPDALYKLGLISKKKGDNEKARKYFDVLIKSYPDDTSAGLAQKELSSL